MEGHGSPAFHVPWLIPCQSLPSTLPLSPSVSCSHSLLIFSLSLSTFPSLCSNPTFCPFSSPSPVTTRSPPLLHSSSVWEKTRKTSWRNGCPSSRGLSPFRSLHRDLPSNKDCLAMEFTVLLGNEFPCQGGSQKRQSDLNVVKEI